MAHDIFNYFIFRDARLQGNLPAIPGTLITQTLDAATPLATAFSRLNASAAMYGKIKTLFVMCHGEGSGNAASDDDFWWRGGLGLELGKEGLNSKNVNAWAAIKNSVETIVIYACGAAYKGPSSPTLPIVHNDGQGLMAALATKTGAVVFASDLIQWYYPDDFNFGKWEGTLYMFLPGGIRVRASAPPAEVIDVISPISDGGNYYTKILKEGMRKYRRNR